MDISQFLLALRARRKAFLLALVATVVTAVAVCLILPKRYTSQATVVVDVRDEQAMAPTRSGAVPLRERASYIATHIELIQSGRVATQVARDLKLAQNQDLRDEWQADTGGQGSIDAWIGASLLQRLKVLNTASNLITIEYYSADPKFAAAVPNAFAKAYLNVVLALRTEPTREAAEWFDAELKAQRAGVDKAQNRIAAYQKEKGIYSGDERIDLEYARLTELNTQMLTARNASYEAQARHKQASELVDSNGSPDMMPEVMSSPAILAVKADLARAESLLKTGSSDLGPNHPLYMRYAAEVQALREKLTNEMKKVVAGLGNVVQQNRRREQDLQVALEAQQKHILKMKDARVELASMTRDLDSAQKTYDTVLTRYMTTQLEARAKQGDAALLTPAIESGKPSFPKIPLITALAVVVGLMLATMMVYALELLDRRVRSRLDLEARLAVPSLGRISRWQPTGGRLLPAPSGAARALPHPW